MLGEFDLIAEFFAPLAAEFPGALGLQDDAAVLRPRAGRDMVVTKDLMVAGVHFRKDDPADLVARKLLRVNLSDLAAMGAEAIGYALGFAMPPDIDIEWVRAFSAGLAQDQQIFDMRLIGGDTVRTPGPLTLSLTAFGSLPESQMLKRSDAKEGDLVIVSGTIGDGFLGLSMGSNHRSNRWPRLSEEHQNYLIERLQVPEPRLALGTSLRGIAHGVADVSDGLAADLEHICKASKLRAIIQAEKIPLSDAAVAVIAAQEPEFVNQLMTGGDDYELLFTIDPKDRESVLDMGTALGVRITEIGKIEAGEGVEILGPDGQSIKLERTGYKHF